MRIITPLAAGAAMLALVACEGGGMTTSEQRMLGGAAAGAGLGFVSAQVLNANPNWTIVSTLGGAAAGAMVARNTNRGECAYARGDGTYVVRSC